MKVKESISRRLFCKLNIILMIGMMVITIYPLLHVLFASFSDSSALLRHRGLLLHPIGFNWNAYKMVLSNPNITSGYMTTIFVVVCGTIINLFMTSIGAFVLSRRKLRGKNILMAVIVLTMYVSGGMIPRYLIIANTLHLGDSLLSLILPGAISTYNLIIMRTNFMQIPQSLEEAAKIDGANDIAILFKVILPLSVPVLAVMTLFYGVSHWNAWFDAMLFLRDRSKYPLQLIMREILISNSTSSMSGASGGAYEIGESIKYATIIFTTVPILLIYPFIQRYFVKGIMIGAIKG